MRQPSLCRVLPIDELPDEPNWLQHQACPIIAYGNGISSDNTSSDGLAKKHVSALNADVIVADEAEAGVLAEAVERTPIAALTLVQVLRSTEHMSLQQGMLLESLAYSTLQTGPEFLAWLESQAEPPRIVDSGDTPAIKMQRDNATVYAQLNRPEYSNSLGVEMRDALIELFELILFDDSIQHLILSGNGRNFCTGGDLREFGLSTNPANAHRIRSTHNPSLLIAQCSDRIEARLHGACIGSGIEIPAFARTVLADKNAFFQLPELSLGLIPGAGGCISVARRIGRQRTALMVLSGQRIDCETALSWGLVDGLTLEHNFATT